MLVKILKRLHKVKLPRVPRLPRLALVALWVGGSAVTIGALWYLSAGHTYDLFQTRGQIATQQRNLFLFAAGLSLIVLLPVYAMIFTFAWRYRAGHKKRYRPNWDSDRRYETIWWGVPILIIAILATVTWFTSHTLDPYRPIASRKPAVHIQVIALQWKWLFLYPDRGVASVNEVALPVGQPVEFDITSDAPMNSFWIPQLAGQIYAMSGMKTQLHVVADSPGNYRGMSSNISGSGFADMHFAVRALPDTAYEQWLTTASSAPRILDRNEYDQLAKPGKSETIMYRLDDHTLFDDVIMKYMATGYEPMGITTASFAHNGENV